MKNKIVKFLKKYWFIIAILIISLARFLFTYKLPSFYLSNMNYDDRLMINQTISLLNGRYLGRFGYDTLIKGPIFPFLLFLIKLYKLNHSCAFTFLYILSCLFFINSLKSIIKDKKYLLLIYLILLFNPVTYSQDLFQRLYRNSISIIEFLFFFGCVIIILFNKNKKFYHYLLYGLSLSFMFLTREDNIWVYPTILFVICYNIIKGRKIKNIIYNFIPIILLIGSLNLISFINYKQYGIYTYNEIQKSEFHNTYKKILQIKDDEKIHQVAIPKSTFYKLADNTKTFNFTHEEIDRFYKEYADESGEIYNGNIIWYFRVLTYNKNKFKNGKESEKYYKKLSKEIDEAFKNGNLEKEFTMPSSFMAVPTINDIKETFINCFYTIWYTTSYKNIKTMTSTKKFGYNRFLCTYQFIYIDYHHTVDIVKRNPLQYELIRIMYYSLTIVFSIVSLLIYLKNILKLDIISIISHILIVCYLLIIGGVSYTHVTSFHAIRPLYLGNIYIIQNIFILINLYRLKKVKKY